jgi:hypothetical protein
LLYILQGLLELSQELTVPSEKSRTKVASENIVVMYTNELIVYVTVSSPIFEGEHRLSKSLLFCCGKLVLVFP